MSLNLVIKMFENLRKKYARQIILDQEVFGKSQICNIYNLESHSNQKIKIYEERILQSTFFLGHTLRTFLCSTAPLNLAFRLPPSKLWIPDIMLYNNADNDYSLGFPTNVVVSSNGKRE